MAARGKLKVPGYSTGFSNIHDAVTGITSRIAAATGAQEPQPQRLDPKSIFGRVYNGVQDRLNDPESMRAMANVYEQTNKVLEAHNTWLRKMAYKEALTQEAERQRKAKEASDEYKKLYDKAKLQRQAMESEASRRGGEKKLNQKEREALALARENEDRWRKFAFPVQGPYLPGQEVADAEAGKTTTEYQRQQTYDYLVAHGQIPGRSVETWGPGPPDVHNGLTFNSQRVSLNLNQNNTPQTVHKPTGLARVGATALKYGGKALGAFGYLQEEAAQPFFAGEHAMLRGAPASQQIQASLLGMPGLGRFARGGVKRDIQATNSRSERDALTAAGRLASPGELVTGRYKNKLNPDIQRYVKGFPTSWLPDQLSGAIDVGWQVGSDPLTYLTAGLNKSAKIGEVATEQAYRKAAEDAGLTAGRLFTSPNQARRLIGQFGDQAVMDVARQGREGVNNPALEAIYDRTIKLLDEGKATDALTLSKRVAGLKYEDAMAVVDAWEKGARTGREALQEAFLSGTYRPHVSIYRQGLLKGTGGRLGLGGPLGPVKAGRIRGGLEALANPTRKGARVLSKEAASDPEVFSEELIAVAARRSRLGSPGDLWERLVAPRIGNGTINDRLGSLVNNALQAGVGEDSRFATYIEREATRIGALSASDPQAAESALRNLETIFALGAGAAGPAARDDIMLNLRALGSRQEVTNTKNLAEAAGKAAAVDARKPVLPGDIYESKSGQGVLFDSRGGLSLPDRSQQLRLPGEFGDRVRQPNGLRTVGEDPAIQAADNLPDHLIPRDKLKQLRLDIGDGRLGPAPDGVQQAFDFTDPANAQFRPGALVNPEQTDFFSAGQLDAADGPNQKLEWFNPPWDEKAANATARSEADRAELEYTRGRLNATEMTNGNALNANPDLAPVVLDQFRKHPELADEFPKSYRAALRQETTRGKKAITDGGKLTFKAAPLTESGLRYRVAQLPEIVREMFVEELDNADGAAQKLRTIANSLNILAEGDAMEKAINILIRQGTFEAYDEILPQGAKFGRNPVRSLARLISSIGAPAVPQSIPFHGNTKNPFVNIKVRTDHFSRMIDHPEFGFDEATKSLFRRRVEKATTEAELFKVEKSALRVAAEQRGIDANQFMKELDEMYSKLKAGYVGGVDENGKAVTKNLVGPRSAINEVPVLDVNRMARVRRGLEGGGLNFARNELHDVADLKVLFGHSPLDAFKGIHRAWKFAIVTNLYAPMLGAYAGYTADQAGGGGGWKGALQGAAIGLLGPTRYILRVPGIEERMRVFLSEGAVNSIFISPLSKFIARKGEYTDLEGMSRALVLHNSAALQGEFVPSRLLSALADSGFEVIGRKDPGFIENYYRALNLQLDPIEDTAHLFALSAQAGHMGENVAESAFKGWLTSEDGKLWLRRNGATFKGTRNADEAWKRVRSFVKLVAPDPRIAEARLNGKLDWETIRGMVKDKEITTPEGIHGQRMFKMPRNAKDAQASWRTIRAQFQSAVLEKPTNVFNRGPMFDHLYTKEYNRLRSYGVEAGKAQRAADEYALEKTDRIMFNINNESRFARKVDYIFPFQQPREEMFQVWPRLIAENPYRFMQATRMAALGFNNGKDMGIFRKNYFGNWQFTIPGSPAIASALFNTPWGFDSNLRDLLFVGQGAFGVGFIPQLGGPLFSGLAKAVIDHDPGFYTNMNPVMKEWLFSYGAGGTFARPEMRRLWMAYHGTAAPWELMTKREQVGELNHWRVEVAQSMIADHGRKTGVYDWLPDPKDVEKATRDLFKARAFMGSITPASSTPLAPTKREYDLVRQNYTSPDGTFDFANFSKFHPNLVPYTIGNKKWVGPDDLDSWEKQSKYNKNDLITHLREYETLGEWEKTFKENRRLSQAYMERSQAFSNPNNDAKNLLLAAWRQKYPDLDAKTRSDYFRDQELVDILTKTPKGYVRDQAIDRWRKTYNVRFTQYQRLSKEAMSDPNFVGSIWRAARYPEQVKADVLEAAKRGLVNMQDPVSVSIYVAGLNPAEQVRYWQQAVVDMNDRHFDPTKDDGQALLDEYKQYKQNIAGVYKTHPELNKGGVKFGALSPADALQLKYDDNNRKQLTLAYQHAYDLSDQVKAAAARKDWTSYYRLKAARDAAFDVTLQLKNAQYRTIPAAEFQLEAGMNEIRSLFGFSPLPASWHLDITGQDPNNIEFLPSSEESYFLNMPDAVKEAYVQDLVNSVSSENFSKGHLKYDWLSNFQKDLLDSNLTPQQIDDIKTLSEADDGSGGGKKFKYFKRSYGYGSKYRSDGRYGPGGAVGGGELEFAFQMFKQYNMRGGMGEPAAYKEYTRLPNNPAMKREFLRQHPEVAKYIKLGPMSNMPPLYRMMVADIMIRWGKWDGDPKQVSEITDLAFAQEQLQRWNRRTGDAPQTYDIWLNMPTGPAKAQYIKQHPEVQNWIALGPMASMPDEYQNVVRDIMQQYGEWTDNQDPLGDVISKYYSTPAYARQQYLTDHPELQEYWNATRTPEERAMSDLADQYFSMPSAGDKKAFLLANPQLQQWFLSQRQKRYESFLKQVAMYMGSNPDLFKSYLDRQEAILSQLLTQFSTPPLMREVSRITQGVSTAAASAGEGGRKRLASASK